jgi:hypothetical protein
VRVIGIGGLMTDELCNVTFHALRITDTQRRWHGCRHPSPSPPVPSF